MLAILGTRAPAALKLFLTTVAIIAAAMTVPLVKSPGAPDAADSPLHRLEHALHPWSAFPIVPLVGVANAGLVRGGAAARIPAGLLLGKQLGIFGSIWLAVKTGIAKRPGNAGWRQIYGVSL